ncbi:MAG: host-nuclease inhibitor Gam family protein [Desulfitobacterium hafniense]|nr:host-nuclease inhibitor Gam family protein [Desulfitobacterium hafniense]
MNWLDEIEIEELSELLTSSTDGTEESPKEKFSITDLSSLNWVLRKLAVLNKSHNEDLFLFNSEIDRINKWFNKQKESHQASVEFLECLVREFANAQRVIDPKWKQKTPYGVVSFRKARKFDYGNEDNLVKYLADNGMGEFLKIEKSPIKSELKKALTITKDGKAIFTSTGEILPEVTAEEIENVTIKLEG